MDIRDCHRQQHLGPPAAHARIRDWSMPDDASRDSISDFTTNLGAALERPRTAETGFVALLAGLVSLVVGVAAGSLVGVEVGGWEEFGSLVGSESHGPAGVGLVDDVVVAAAQGYAVVAVGAATLAPVPDVVDFCPAAGAVAAGKRATAIPQQHGGAGGAGVRPAAAADIDRNTRAV